MEHRWGERFAIDMPVGLGVPLSTPKRGRLVNLSLSGAFIKTSLDVRLLSRLQVVFKPGRGRKHSPVTISAYVARKADEGIGVEWCDFAPTVVAELIRTTTQRHPRLPKEISERASTHGAATSTRPP